MSDDIKIEEHDLLDNPHIRTIFPDLSMLKKEIENYFDDVTDVKEEPVSVCSPLDQKTVENSCIDELNFLTNDQSLPVRTRSLDHSSNSRSTSHSTVNIVESNASTVPVQRNKIIIGSKPNKKLDYEEFFKRKVRSDQPRVLLDDLGSYLNRSDKYCRECFILFPTKVYLENHNKTEHRDTNRTNVKKRRFKQKRFSINYHFKKIKCNICNKHFSTKGSLQRHCRNFHNGNRNMKAYRINNMITKVQNDICSNQSLPSDENMSCFHCKLLFPTQKSLIEHLYNVLQSKSVICKTNTGKSTTNKKSKKFACSSSMSFKCKNKSAEQVKEQLTVANTKNTKTLYYRCDICYYHFTDKNICLTHRRNDHGVLNYLDVVQEPYEYNSKCKYCSIELKDVSEYNKHLIENHKQQHTFAMNKSTPMIKKDKIQIPVSKKQPKAQYPSDPINLKDSNSITAPSQHNLIEKPKYAPIAFKSILFKCNKCDIHFLSAKLAMSHTDHMEMLINWKCSTCQRILKKEDELLHEKQHLLSHEFDVHELCTTEFSRILYNCHNCAIHFTEDNFLTHYEICGIETRESVYCKHCDILIDCEIGILHESSHQKDNLVSTDFTIINSEIIPSDEMLKSTNNKHTNIRSRLKRRNNIGASEPFSKKRKLDLGFTFNIMNLTFCTTCKCYISDVYKRRVHLQSRCAHLIKYVCKFCGLVLTAKSYQSHKNLHLKMKNLKLQDFTFFEMGSDKEICPPVPEYFKCKICEVSFISKVASTTHECSEEEYLTCHICETKLSEAAFKLHMLFHHYSNTNAKTPLHAIFPILQENSNENVTESLSQNKENSAKIFKPVAPEYSKDSSCTEGFIFFCSNCSVAVDTYEKVIIHCHQHYSIEDNEINTEMCDICSLKFDITCYENHQMLHIKYDQKIFRVLKFDTFYFKLENNIWLKHLFDPLPQEQIDKIVGTSIFKFEARMKMKIIQDGPPELTVYKCDKCKSFIDGTSLYRHAENSCFKLRRHPCSYCGLPFISAISRMEHEKIHISSNNISSKSYRIVAFNRNEDQLFNRKLYSCRHFVLYQCRNCDGVVDKLQIPNHECYRLILKKCLLCGLLIYCEEYDVHALRHKELPNFNKDNMKVILFGDKFETGNNGGEMVPSFSGSICDYIFYSCTKCQVCVKSLECTFRHRCVFGVSKSKCPKCELSFTMKKLKQHLKLHETDPDFIRGNMKLVAFDPPETNFITTSSQKTFEGPLLADSITEKKSEKQTEIFFNNTCKTDNLVKNNKIDLRIKDVAGGIEELSRNNKQIICDDVRTNAKLYKCTCGLHFLDEVTINNHLKICSPKIRASKQKCTKCNLLFTPNILFSHLLVHHGNKKLEYNFEIVEMTKSTKYVLYNCSKCQFHFVKEQDVMEHLKICETDKNEGKKCDICNLVFNNSSIILHINLHHKQSQGSKEYEIIECGFTKRFGQNANDSLIDTLNDKNNLMPDQPMKKWGNYDRNIYKCKKCSIHYLTKKAMKLHLSENHKNFTKLQDICNICGLNFVSYMLANHIDIHHEKLKLKPNDMIVIECVEDI